MISGMFMWHSLSKLGSTLVFEKNIIQPSVRTLQSLANKFYDKITASLEDVKANRTYANTFNYQRTHRRTIIIHQHTRTTVPYCKIYRGRNRCLLLATSTSINHHDIYIASSTHINGVGKTVQGTSLYLPILTRIHL